MSTMRRTNPGKDPARYRCRRCGKSWSRGSLPPFERSRHGLTKCQRTGATSMPTPRKVVGMAEPNSSKRVVRVETTWPRRVRARDVLGALYVILLAPALLFVAALLEVR
jgi:transposase-like protein